MIFTDDASLPRTRAGVALWVETVAAFLARHEADDALRKRVRHLP